jgi:hypothetical protein
MVEEKLQPFQTEEAVIEDILASIESYCKSCCRVYQAYLEAEKMLNNGQISETMRAMVWQAKLDRCDKCKLGKVQAVLENRRTI